jgi:ABC-2 type transport system ATP-binding protein
MTTNHALHDGPAIEVESLTKRFGSVVALDGIDLSVPAGTVFGLLGPNGAGKTTTVRILTTILQPDDGHARVLGLDVCREPQAVRASLGLAGQYAAVDEHLTARENLKLAGWLTGQPRVSARARGEELLERFDLTAAADRVAGTYSGGMRKRLDLAVALVHRPPVLFLDEPTTGLDPQGRGDLWELIEELVAEGMTLLLTTQYLEEADRLADRIAVVDDGRVVAEGTAAELKSRLGSTIIDVGLPDPASAARARVLLEPFGPAEIVDGTAVEVNVDDGARVLLQIVRLLDQERLEPETVAIREPTLDDVFLTLTGRRAEASGGAEPDTNNRGRARRRGAQRGAA